MWSTPEIMTPDMILTIRASALSRIGERRACRNDMTPATCPGQTRKAIPKVTRAAPFANGPRSSRERPPKPRSPADGSPVEFAECTSLALQFSRPSGSDPGTRGLSASLAPWDLIDARLAISLLNFRQGTDHRSHTRRREPDSQQSRESSPQRAQTTPSSLERPTRFPRQRLEKTAGPPRARSSCTCPLRLLLTRRYQWCDSSIAPYAR